MGTEVTVILGHHLRGVKIAELPASLNEYSRGDAGRFRLRFSHSMSGEIREQDGKWVWQPDIHPEWALEEGDLVSEDRWEWDWKAERDGNFGQWFADNIKLGRLRLTSTISSLYIGLHSALLVTFIEWRNFHDPVVQVDLRHYARFLTGFFGGSSVIYVPDDIEPGCEAGYKVVDGWSIDQITNWLRRQTAPAISIEDIVEPVYYRGVRGFHPHGYYIDDFHDLDRA